VDAFSPRNFKKGPEAKIQEDIIKYLRMKTWLVISMHGNMYQRGLPDLWASHYLYGARWIEIKLPNMVGSKFTPAQMEYFPKICANGSGVWIMTADTDDEYEKLFKSSNWAMYLGIMR